MKPRYPPVFVQRGTAEVLHYGNDGKTTDIPIEDVGSLARALERGTGITAISGPVFYTLYLLDATTLRLKTLQAGSAGLVYVNWEVLSGDYIAEAQRGTVSYTFTGTAGEVTSNVTLNSMGDLSRSRVERMSCHDNWNASLLAGARIRLTSITNLEAKFYSGGNNVVSTNYLAYKIR